MQSGNGGKLASSALKFKGGIASRESESLSDSLISEFSSHNSSFERPKTVIEKSYKQSFTTQ